MTTILSVRLDTRTKKRLEALARRARRSKSFLAAEAIAAFVETESDNPEAATRIGRALLDAVEHLAELPGLGRPGRVAGTRELVVAGTPCAIPYRLRGDRLEVIAVFHGRQKWPKAL